MSTIELESTTLHCVCITHKTRWSFVRLTTTDGSHAVGEATLIGQEDALCASAERLVPRLFAMSPFSDPGEFAQANPPENIHDAAIISAINQALWSLDAQAHDRPLAAHLGVQRSDIPVYANINRRTEQRTPGGFAGSAITAMDAGHTAFKVAPFDEVTTDICAEGNGIAAMQNGLARVAAARDAVGPNARLMIDCHWRFDEATSVSLIDAAAKLDIYWVETPLPEIEANIPALARLRQQCNETDMLLAGLETSVRWDSFRPFCEGCAYDVVMPDIKYVGGIFEMQKTASRCAELGLAVSPHNPSGPVCHAASLQLSATLPGFDRLELQFDESPIFDELVGAPFAGIENGQTVAPQAPGLGVTLDNAVIERYADRPARTWKR
ncbi:MAG: hypothetical protein CNE99_03445 [OM182 bacterium MED-G24]|uniref:Mandelate racemase/muconate lactonizing enzyme C-terminal domain-containing protein n=1 Tax=OM182 bacterium MED-G24 TaxID=1986255 RepID=A0A2A5WVQ9_9GAMM|nr:MAG: hypothetical protein CNE99_03445 [OM182 bacterium MED-G24]